MWVLLSQNGQKKRKNSPITNGVARMIITYNCFQTKGLICCEENIQKSWRINIYLYSFFFTFFTRHIHLFKKMGCFCSSKIYYCIMLSKTIPTSNFVVFPLGQMGSFSYLNECPVNNVLISYMKFFMAIVEKISGK